MKKSLISMVLSFSAALSQAAGGPWDGIYSCAVSAPGIATQAYITVNGQPDGQSIFAVAAVTPNSPFYGYGIGRVQGNVFSGTTMFGKTFSMVPAAGGFTGTIGIIVNNFSFTAYANCLKIW